MEYQQQKNAERLLEGGGQQIEKLQIQKKRMGNYVDDINKLLKDIGVIQEKRDMVFKAFDKEIPESVRSIRDSQKSLADDGTADGTELGTADGTDDGTAVGTAHGTVDGTAVGKPPMELHLALRMVSF